MVYNTTWMDTGTNFYDFFQGVNTTVDGWLVFFLLFSMFFILMVAFKRYDTADGLIATSSILSLLTVFAWSMTLIKFGFIFIPLAVLFGALIWKGLS